MAMMGATSSQPATQNTQASLSGVVQHGSVEVTMDSGMSTTTTTTLQASQPASQRDLALWLFSHKQT